jgi:hypothetical protein
MSNSSIGGGMLNRQGFILLSLCLVAIVGLVHTDNPTKNIKESLKSELSRITTETTQGGTSGKNSNMPSLEEQKVMQVKAWLRNRASSGELSPAGLPKSFNSLGELLSYANKIQNKTEAKIKGLYINMVNDESLDDSVPAIKKVLKGLGNSYDRYYIRMIDVVGILIGLIYGSNQSTWSIGAAITGFFLGSFTNGWFAEDVRSTLQGLLNEHDAAREKILVIEELLKYSIKI